MFFKGWIEPQAVVRLVKRTMKSEAKSELLEEAAYFPRVAGSRDPSAGITCYDVRPSSDHAGWCKTHEVDANDKRGKYFRSWGFCDQSLMLNFGKPSER